MELNERKEFFRQLGLPRHEVYEWAKRSLEIPNFDIGFYRARRHQLRSQRVSQTKTDERIFNEIKEEYRKINLPSRHRNKDRGRTHSSEMSKRPERSRNDHDRKPNSGRSRSNRDSCSPPSPPRNIKNWLDSTNSNDIANVYDYKHRNRVRSRSRSPHRNFREDNFESFDHTRYNRDNFVEFEQFGKDEISNERRPNLEFEDQPNITDIGDNFRDNRYEQSPFRYNNIIDQHEIEQESKFDLSNFRGAEWNITHNEDFNFEIDRNRSLNRNHGDLRIQLRESERKVDFRNQQEIQPIFNFEKMDSFRDDFINSQERKHNIDEQKMSPFHNRDEFERNERSADRHDFFREQQGMDRLDDAQRNHLPLGEFAEQQRKQYFDPFREQQRQLVCSNSFKDQRVKQPQHALSDYLNESYFSKSEELPQKVSREPTLNFVESSYAERNLNATNDDIKRRMNLQANYSLKQDQELNRFQAGRHGFQNDPGVQEDLRNTGHRKEINCLYKEESKPTSEKQTYEFRSAAAQRKFENREKFKRSLTNVKNVRRKPYIRPENYGDYVPGYKMPVQRPRGFWQHWWKTNCIIEEQILQVKENDKELLNVIEILNTVKGTKKDRQMLSKYIRACEKTILNSINQSIKTGHTVDAYDFLKAKVIIAGFVSHLRYHLTKAGRKILANLKRVINKVDMCNYYLAIIETWKMAFDTMSRKNASNKEAAANLMKDKVFNWLVNLAFKQIKLISYPVINPIPMDEKLYEFCEFLLQSAGRQRTVNRVFFYHSGIKNANRTVADKLAYIQHFLKCAPVPLNYDACYQFLIARILLKDTAWDDKIDSDLKNEKDEVMASLSTYSVVESCYKYMIEKVMKIRDRISYLSNTHKKLLTIRDQRELHGLKLCLKRPGLIFACKFIMIERKKKLLDDTINNFELYPENHWTTIDLEEKHNEQNYDHENEEEDDEEEDKSVIILCSDDEIYDVDSQSEDENGKDTIQ